MAASASRPSVRESLPPPWVTDSSIRPLLSLGSFSAWHLSSYPLRFWVPTPEVLITGKVGYGCGIPLTGSHVLPRMMVDKHPWKGAYMLLLPFSAAHSCLGVFEFMGWGGRSQWISVGEPPGTLQGVRESVSGHLVGDPCLRSFCPFQIKCRVLSEHVLGHADIAPDFLQCARVLWKG